MWAFDDAEVIQQQEACKLYVPMTVEGFLEGVKFLRRVLPTAVLPGAAEVRESMQQQLLQELTALQQQQQIPTAAAAAAARCCLRRWCRCCLG